jgi:hypothetical protein
MFVQSFEENFENKICGNSITTIEANGNAARGGIASHISLRTGRVGPAHVLPNPHLSTLPNQVLNSNKVITIVTTPVLCNIPITERLRETLLVMGNSS